MNLPTFAHTTTSCPACSHQFCTEKVSDLTVVWCGNGRCKSEMANGGIQGHGSPEELAQSLVRQMNLVQDWIGEEPE